MKTTTSTAHMQFINIDTVKGIATTSYGLIPFKAHLRPRTDLGWTICAEHAKITLLGMRGQTASAQQAPLQSRPWSTKLEQDRRTQHQLQSSSNKSPNTIIHEMREKHK